jgi:hypothetical protein
MFHLRQLFSHSLSFVCKGTKSDKLSVALNRFQKEDPTFRVGYDRESEQVSFVVLLGLLRK